MNQLDFDLSSFEQIWADLYQEYDFLASADYLDKSNLLNVENFNLVDFVQSLIDYGMYEVSVAFIEFKSIFILIILIALFRQLKNMFSNRYDEMTTLILKLMLVISLVQLFMFYHDFTYDILTRYMGIVVTLFPILLSMITMTGALWNHALFQPVIVFLINASYFFINSFSLPLIVMGTVLGFINKLSKEDFYSRLTVLINKVATWSLGAYFGLFLTLLSIQNITLSFTNGLFLRTGQSLVNHIPVIGTKFTDTVISVVSTLSILRNSVGLLAVITLVVFVAFPILKLGIVSLLFRLLSALVQPLLDKEYVEVLDVFNTAINGLLIVMFIIGVMFIFTIVIILFSSNMMLLTS